MSKFFINRPIVAIVIAILMTIVGTVAMIQLPIAQFPKIVPPEIQVRANYTGADAQTIEQSVAAPIEQQMSGVDQSNYIQSVNANGSIRMTINFDITTDPNTDQILSQLRVSQATSQLPTDVINAGVTVQKSTTAPLMLVSLNSPKGTYDNIFLANYANINLQRPGIRRGPVCDAAVGETRSVGETERDRSRHHECFARAEHGQSRRTNWR